MADESLRVHFDEDVASNILRVFDDAREYVVAVSPWLHLWGHAKNAIKKAQKRKVDVFFVIRRDNDARDNRSADLKWLQQQGVTVFQAEGLHAKIFFNEETVLLTSMNLLSGSSRNSLEVACTLKDKESQHQIRRYVKQSVIEIAGEIVRQPSAGRVAKADTSKSAHPAGLRGFCLRCQKQIGLDESRPLCPNCYGEWKQWRNRDYMEKFCHKCGSPSVTSFRYPTCYPCFSGLR